MTTLLLLLGAAFLVSGGLALVLLRHAAKADDVYPPEAAEAPDLVERAYTDAGDTFGFQRTSYFVDGGHPKNCTERCCWEIRLTEKHDAFDWHAAEHEMRSKR